MSSKTGSSENTIQADVAPGDKTGIYYITICNLPFGTSWQELKDWLRQICVVDHIELFQTSTSGWVRLKGNDNFERAWKQINTVEFKGRSIIGSDKNRTESIKIKELVESPSQSKSERSSPAPFFRVSSHTQLHSTQYTAPSYGQQVYVHGYPQSSTMVGYSADPRAMATPAYNNAPAISHHHTPVDAYAMATTSHWASYAGGPTHGLGLSEQRSNLGTTGHFPHDGVQFTVPYCTHPDLLSYGNPYNNVMDSVASNSYVSTEPRRIFLTSLPSRASREEKIAWIRHKAGPFANDIVHIDVPSQDGKSRGKSHVFVLFKNIGSAHGAVALLDQAVFQARRVSARFTTEGITLDEQNPNTPLAASHAHKQTKEVRENGAKGHRSKPHDSDQASPKGKSKSGDKKENNRPSEKQETKIWPVIADGSSHRRSDKRK